MTDFPQTLKELRLERQLTQSELADLLIINQRTISSWENGSREPDYDMLVKIAKFFYVTTDYLLGVED